MCHLNVEIIIHMKISFHVFLFYFSSSFVKYDTVEICFLCWDIHEFPFMSFWFIFPALFVNIVHEKCLAGGKFWPEVSVKPGSIGVKTFELKHIFWFETFELGSVSNLKFTEVKTCKSRSVSKLELENLTLR